MSKEVEKQIIENYQKDENMMILIFAQWCVNNDLDPVKLYTEAYPNQASSPALLKTMEELTVDKVEAGEIPTSTVLNVLSLFGNEDLAFVVTQYANK